MKMNTLKYLLLLSLLIIFFSCESNPVAEKPEDEDIAETLLNLDFEQVSSEGLPKRWYIGGAGYEIVCDNTYAYSGKSSLRMVYNSGESFGVATSTFPLEDALGKRLKFIGYIKSENITTGYAGLWMRVDGENGQILAFDNMYDRGVTGTKNWQKYQIEFDVSNEAKNINFGALLSGNGKAWFDAFSFEINGQLYEPPLLFDVNNEQLAWLKTNAQHFDTEEPGTDFDDLMFLKELIGSAHIVSLGEGTHGTSEFFKMKHRIAEFLAHEMDFTIFAIEANMPECREINHYVLTGEGNAREALRGIYFWTWYTQEVLDMIEWMRDFNESGLGQMQFLGFDMQYTEVAMTNVEQFVTQVDPDFLSTVQDCYNIIRPIVEEQRQSYYDSSIKPDYDLWKSKAQTVLLHLENQRNNYITIKDAMEVDWIIQDARVVLQAAALELRDKSMAENVDWILAHSPANTKIVLWAHNGHVSKRAGWMGDYLNQQHGSDMVVFGFCFHEGTYTAVGDQGLGTYGTSSSEVGSLEWAFHRTGFPRFMLDLRLASPGDPNSSWLTQSLDFRSIGALAVQHAFYPTKVTDQFDILIYFDQTNPSALLHDYQTAKFSEKIYPK